MKRRSFLIGAAALMIQPYRVGESAAQYVIEDENQWGDWRFYEVLPDTPELQYLKDNPWGSRHFFHWQEYEPETNVRFIDEPVGMLFRGSVVK